MYFSSFMAAPPLFCIRRSSPAPIPFVGLLIFPSGAEKGRLPLRPGLHAATATPSFFSFVKMGDFAMKLSNDFFGPAREAQTSKSLPRPAPFASPPPGGLRHPLLVLFLKA